MSSHFPNAGIEEVRMSVDFYWKEMKFICEHGVLACPSFVWILKVWLLKYCHTRSG